MCNKILKKLYIFKLYENTILETLSFKNNYICLITYGGVHCTNLLIA